MAHVNKAYTFSTTVTYKGVTAARDSNITSFSYATGGGGVLNMIPSAFGRSRRTIFSIPRKIYVLKNLVPSSFFEFRLMGITFNISAVLHLNHNPYAVSARPSFKHTVPPPGMSALSESSKVVSWVPPVILLARCQWPAALLRIWVTGPHIYLPDFPQENYSRRNSALSRMSRW
jgi:hypothetical protein